MNMKTYDTKIGSIAAAFLAAFIVADMAYAGTMRRDTLLSSTDLLLGCLAIFALFGHRMTEFVFDKGKISFKQQLEAVYYTTTAANLKRTDPNEPQIEAGVQAREIVGLVSGAAESNTASGMASSSILWVDDRPSNNVNERQALEAFGIKVTISESTEDALNKLRVFKYDVIISDMGRPPDPQAGYTLLDAVKKLGKYPPFIIYAGGRSPELSALTKERGGWDTTNRPQELIQFVLSALKKQGKL